MDLIVGQVSGKGTCIFKGSHEARNQLEGAEDLAVFFGKGERVEDVLNALGDKVTSIHVFAYVDMTPGEAMDAILRHINPQSSINSQVRSLDSTLALAKEKSSPASKPPRIRPSRSKKKNEQLADLQEETSSD